MKVFSLQKLNQKKEGLFLYFIVVVYCIILFITTKFKRNKKVYLDDGTQTYITY